ncbi:hypothetical protein, partial [Acidovorax sp. 24-64-9]|uniref:hypothetical protein n=1 Tax=Acidovorax sp. 24-64-9 TaxID=1970309 RepID=UPI0025C10AF2
LLKPASIANELNEIQIVDTHESSETRFNTGVAALQHQISRTLLSLYPHSPWASAQTLQIRP